MHQQQCGGSALAWFLGLLLLTAAGALLVPFFAYLAGQQLAGAYPGAGGFGGYLLRVYAAAGRAELPAWTVLAGPAAMVIVWYAIGRAWRRGR